MGKKQKAYTIIKSLGTTGVSSSQIAGGLGVTRAYAQRLAKELIADGLVLVIGKGVATRYISADKKPLSHSYGRLLKREGLDEDIVYQEVVSTVSNISTLPDNVQAIFRYSFTEMLNNAIDHSRSERVRVEVETTPVIRFLVRDWGIGIFENIRQTFKTENIEEAIAEVTKGKRTTAAERHSGEGIFFTSRALDSLTIRGSGKEITFNNRVGDIFLRNTRVHEGTEVIGTIDTNSSRDIAVLFRSYTNEAYEFNKTAVMIKLFAIGKDRNYISRSQARRVLEGLEKFSKITLDFKDIESIGQGFAHELFAVWQKNHPEIELSWENTNENVLFMIRHSK